jgi:type VI secretion system protein ImpA
MSLRDELLKPIAGSSPGGVDLRYDPIYDKIKEARREDDDAPQGEWATTRKSAEWPVVIKLAKEALATKSKDLQLGAWLTEAMVRREGFAGLSAGLDLLAGLVDEHWDHLFPEIDDGDAEMRAAPLEWVGLKLEIPVRMVGLDKAGNTSFQHKESRFVLSEAAAAESSEKTEARQAAVAAGKKTPEDIDAAFTATPKPWFKTLVADIDSSLAALKRLDDVSDAKFGDVAPSYSKLRETIEDVQRLAAQQLKRKLELEPDPVEVNVSAEGDGAAASSGAAAASGPLAPEPVSRDDATSRIVSAAKYLRRSDPFNPAAYLLLRGLRWGELRASATLDPKLLEAPPTSVRTMLKGLLLDARWPELLEAAEGVMGTGQGRGWLDLQRYALTACDSLGSDYFAVGAALRGALRSLLADLPQLLDMTLMDDTPTANAETRTWLRAEILRAGEAPAPSDAAADVGAPEDNGAEPRPKDPFSLAAAEARAGRADRAISILMREAAREKTSRGRFLVQAQLARIMVDAGHEAVATPILEQLIGDVEKHQLENWESGDLVATPMALMYRVLTKTQADETLRQSLYLRICRLDPIQAIGFSQS